jgi:hypothetical protein
MLPLCDRAPIRYGSHAPPMPVRRDAAADTRYLNRASPRQGPGVADRDEEYVGARTRSAEIVRVPMAILRGEARSRYAAG